MIHKILVVDDEPAIADILERFLRKNGFEVTSAVSGEKAIEMLGGGIEADFMVLDMKMPKVNGVDVLRELKRLNRKMPFVVLSGSLEMRGYKKELADLGYSGYEYLMKPIDLDELLDVIRKIES
ncbi:MAG: response regulator [Candidatus Omnitrophota bacterium]